MIWHEKLWIGLAISLAVAILDREGFSRSYIMSQHVLVFRADPKAQYLI